MSANNGKPCRKCGANEWHRNGNCAPCARQRRNLYHAANKEKENQRSRDYHHSNSKRIKEIHGAWQRANRTIMNIHHRNYKEKHSDRVKVQRRVYREKHPEKAAVRHARRRTNITNAGGTFTAAEWKGIVEHYGNKCLCCGRSDIKLTVDHVIPVSRGGSSNADNLQPLCIECNRVKSDKTIDYRPDKGDGCMIQPKLFNH